MAWKSPTGHVAASGWASEANVYDGDTDIWAGYRIAPSAWSPFLVLTIDSTTSNKLRFNALYHATTINKIDIDVYKDGGWVGVYAGAYTDHVWVEKIFASGQVTKIRARFYNASAMLVIVAKWYECELWEVPVAKGAMQTGKYWGEPI